MSGRELARRAATNTHDHWAQILRGKKVMTTNDVKVAADVFELSPYDFVSGARLFAASRPGDVGGREEDGDVLDPERDREIRRSDVDLAAFRGRNDADAPTE